MFRGNHGTEMVLILAMLAVFYILLAYSIIRLFP